MSSCQSSLSTRVASIYINRNLKAIAAKYGVDINSVTFEDTSRKKGSYWGDNISDMTLVVENKGRNNSSTRMPVIRKPNFSDETADMSIDKFNVTVGNERGQELRRIPLREYLKDISKYTVRNSSQTENTKIKSMLLDRDDSILTSVQFCVLPLQDGECEFSVQLYNYQSSATDPAVLVIVSSSQGTSAQVVTGETEKLYINMNGRSANYLAKRLKDDRKEKGKALEGAMDLEEQERNVLSIIQIPLKRKPPPRVFRGLESCGSEYGNLECGFVQCSINNSAPGTGGVVSSFMCDAECDDEEDCDDEWECVKEKCADRDSTMKSRSTVRGMDNAVLRPGETHSEFKGVGDYSLERDHDYPIRCTFQFYKVTDTDDIPEQAFSEMREKIDKVYSSGSVTGSLVVSGDTGRVTETTVHKDVESKQRMDNPMFSFFKNTK